jgi:hypothetical protein
MSVAIVRSILKNKPFCNGIALGSIFSYTSFGNTYKYIVVDWSHMPDAKEDMKEEGVCMLRLGDPNYPPTWEGIETINSDIYKRVTG